MWFQSVRETMERRADMGQDSSLGARDQHYRRLNRKSGLPHLETRLNVRRDAALHTSSTSGKCRAWNPSSPGRPCASKAGSYLEIRCWLASRWHFGVASGTPHWWLLQGWKGTGWIERVVRRGAQLGFFILEKRRATEKSVRRVD